MSKTHRPPFYDIAGSKKKKNRAGHDTRTRSKIAIYKIYTSLEKFQLQIIPKSVDVTISNIFSEGLEKISQKLETWASEWS